MAERYSSTSEAKSAGAVYTPLSLATFVAEQIVGATLFERFQGPVRVLDPSVGDGALLLSLMAALRKRTDTPVSIFGFDTNPLAVYEARRRLALEFPYVEVRIEVGDFLSYVLNNHSAPTLFSDVQQPPFDMVIANPPYVRTQIMGSEQSQDLASSFDLAGRVDLYHAFLIAISRVLRPDGTAGIIVSNRFMTTKGGAAVRAALRQCFTLRHIWDLGDTKIFDAAVLPAIVLASGHAGSSAQKINFTSIYETSEPASHNAVNPIDALTETGIVALRDGRRFHVQHGVLHNAEDADAIWRIATKTGDIWLATVESHSWGKFRDIGKIRVGVKTCADGIFIRSDWNDAPELLRPLTTHHCAGRFRAIPTQKAMTILYPHTMKDGRRQAVDLNCHPKSRAYLEAHKAVLTARRYVVEGGRQWYEIWVPQDPSAWSKPKLVFRDISTRPTFWLDLDGTIVNGDCYWLTADNLEDRDFLWLAAAVANSTFAEAFYDHRFNNKLYSGRRRFMSQYVEQFPLPDPSAPLSLKIIQAAKEIYEIANTPESEQREADIDRMVWRAFGFSAEEISG